MLSGYHSVPSFLYKMFKYLVLLCLALATTAHPTKRTQEEIEEYKSFLLKTKEDGSRTLKEAMTKNPRANVWENSGKYQGDILLFDEEIEAMVDEFAGNDNKDDPKARNALIHETRRWPGKTIYYEIARNNFNRNQISMIEQAAKFFGDNTCVKWVRRTNQRQYVNINARRDGCFANVGYNPNERIHNLNLAPDCFNVYIIIHEMYHIAGFHHMHQTYNRNDSVIINFRNVDSSMKHNFDIYSSELVTLLNLPYEYGSNQHYGAYAFSKNGGKTIIPKHNDGGLMGQQRFMTRFDVLRLARLYNCPGAWRVQVYNSDLGKPYDKKFAQRMQAAARSVQYSRDIEDTNENIEE